MPTPNTSTVALTDMQHTVNFHHDGDDQSAEGQSSMPIPSAPTPPPAYSSLSFGSQDESKSESQRIQGSEIKTWWDGLTKAQQDEIIRVYNEQLSEEEKQRIQASRQIKQPEQQFAIVQHTPQYVYITNDCAEDPAYSYSSVGYRRYPHYYDYYSMYWMSRSVGNLMYLQYKFDAAVLKGIVDVTGKIGHHIMSAAPSVINAVGNLGASGLNAVAHGGSVVLHGLANLGGEAIHLIGNAGSAAINGIGKVGAELGHGLAGAGGEALKLGGQVVDGVGNAAKGASSCLSGDDGKDAGSAILIVLAVIAFLIVFSVAVGTAVSFAGYAIKKMYDAVKHIKDRCVESVLTFGAVAGGTALGAIKGALIGAAIGSAIPGLGTAAGAVIGAVLGACVSAGIFAGLGRFTARIYMRVKIGLGMYGDADDLICKVHPEEYLLSNKDKEVIDTKVTLSSSSSLSSTVYSNDTSYQRINTMMRAIHRQRDEIDAAKYIIGTDKSAQYDAYKVLLKQHVKTGDILNTNSVTVDNKHEFTWNTDNQEFTYNRLSY